MKMTLIDKDINSILKMDDIDNVLFCRPYKHHKKNSKDAWDYGIYTKQACSMTIKEMKSFLNDPDGFVCKIEEL